jgi:hypothetical protein
VATRGTEIGGLQFEDYTGKKLARPHPNKQNRCDSVYLYRYIGGVGRRIMVQG